MEFGNFRECDLILVLKCIAKAEALRATSNFRTFTNIQLYNDALGGAGMAGVSDVLMFLLSMLTLKWLSLSTKLHLSTL